MDALTPGSVALLPVRQRRSMQRYLGIWAATLALLLAAVIGICVLVDPYAVFGTTLIDGLNGRKTAAIAWPRLSKAYMIQRQRPKTLILGNSSADVGFNPDSAVWPQSARPVFNLAVDGGLPATHLRYLQHALAGTAPSRVIIAVNFNESLVMPQGPRVSAAVQSQFDFEPRMRVLADGTPNPGYPRGHAADLVFATLSFSALSDSIKTVLHQNDLRTPYQSAQGWNSGAMMAGWTRDDGAYAMMMRKDREKIAQYESWRGSRALDIDAVFRAIRLANARGADVAVVILPTHADGLEVLRQLGLDADYGAWKTALVRGIAGAAPDGRAIVWDFSGYSPYTTEDLPAPGDRSHGLRWFYEPVHFTAALGDVMAARIEGAAEPASFGVRLTPDNVAGQIAAYHAGQAAWVASHPDDVARIAGLIGAAK